MIVDDASDLAPNLLSALQVAEFLFERGEPIVIGRGVAAGVHTEQSWRLHIALILADEARRLGITEKGEHGLLPPGPVIAEALAALGG